DILHIGDALLEIVAFEMVPHRPNCPRSRPRSNWPTQRHPKLVKRPYLHGLDALSQQLLRKLAAMAFEPALEVLMLAVAHTGVVDPNRLAAAAAQQVVDGLAGILSQQVPQRHVHRADRPHLAAAIA